MFRRLGTGTSLALAGLMAFAVCLESGNVAMAAGGVIEGTIKASGLASNDDAVIYISQMAGSFPASAKPAAIDQRSMQFLPHVLPIVAGTTVRFLNSDPTPHNVFSPDHEKYNLGTWPQGETKEHVFGKCAKAPCVYVQLCRIHPEMEGYVVVLQNPFFAVSGRDGHYRIENVPPGSYSLGVWHAKLKAAPKPVTVDAAKPAVVDFAMSK